MKILFICAKLHTVEPFGIMCISAVLKKEGHVVALFEAEDRSLVQKCQAYKPDIIGYSVCTGAQDYYLNLNRYLKKQCTFISVFGGPHPTFFPDMIYEDGVDVLFCGEAEAAFAQFCALYQKNKEIPRAPNSRIKRNGQVESTDPLPLIHDLDSLPFADRELYYHVSPEIAHHPVRSFLASRGCPYFCSYCFNHALNAMYQGAWQKVRVRSPQHVIQEIVSIQKKYPTEFIAFRESIFPIEFEWLKEFSSSYKKKVGLPFYCHLRLDLLNEQNVTLLADAGCYSVNVGIECGNERLRASLLHRPMSNALIKHGCSLLLKQKIRILANNMLGLPGTTVNHDFETLRLNQECKVTFSLAMLYTPYPGTKLADFAHTQGFFNGNYSSLHYTYYSSSSLSFSNSLEKRRIENLQKLFALAVVLPWLTGVVKILTFLPGNRIFIGIFRMLYLIFHQTEIFSARIRMRDWIANTIHIFKEP